MQSFSTAPRFEVLPDGTVYARAGVQTNCAGIAAVHVRINLNPEGEDVFSAAPGERDEESLVLPGLEVHEGYRAAVYRGALDALEGV